MLALYRLILIEMTQNLERIRDANVEGIRLEGLIEQGSRLVLAAKPHVQHAQARLGSGQFLA